MRFWGELRVDGRLPAAFWVGACLKGGLVVLLLLPLLQPGLEQFDGKGMNWRILIYPLAGVIIPLLWHATGSSPPYPYLADNLLVLPALADVMWNTLDAYDRVWWWDDVNHLVNAMIFAAVIGLWASRYPLGAVTRFTVAFGLSVVLEVIWEIGEYAVFITSMSEKDIGYPDTIGDLSFGLIGAGLGAWFALLAVRTAEPEQEPARAIARS